MMQCWNRNPAERPSFETIRNFLAKSFIEVMKASQDFKKGDTEMFAEKGDNIAVIDANPEEYWWRGQNLRTFTVGKFPRCLVRAKKAIQPEDVGKPLAHTFIHTGHGGMAGKSWGNPTTIENLSFRKSKVGNISGALPNFSAAPADRLKRSSPKPLLTSSQKQFNYVKLRNETIKEAVEAVTNNASQVSAKPVEELLIDISPTSNHKMDFPLHQEGERQISVSPSRSIIDMPLGEETNTFVSKYSNSPSASYCNLSTENPDPFDTSYVNAPSCCWNNADSHQTVSSISSRMINTIVVEDNYNDLYRNVHMPFSIPSVFDSESSAELKKKLNLEVNIIPTLKPFLPQQSCQVLTSSLKNNPHQIKSTLSTSTESSIQISHPPISLAKANNVVTDLRHQQLQPALNACLSKPVEPTFHSELPTLSGAHSAIDLVLLEKAESPHSTNLQETNSLFSRMEISNKTSQLQNNIFKGTNCKYEKTPMHTELMGILSKTSGNQTMSSYTFDKYRVKNKIQDARSNCSNIAVPPTKSCNPINVVPRIHNDTRLSFIDANIHDEPYPVVLIDETIVTGPVSYTNTGNGVDTSNYCSIDESVRKDNNSFNLYDSVPDDDICDDLRVTTNICSDNNMTSSMNSKQREQGTCKNIYDSVTGEYHQSTSYYDTVEDDSSSSAYLTAPLNVGSKDKIAWLMADLQGNTYEEECIDALNACNWDIPSAARYIKLQKLANLGLVSERQCRNFLEECNWNVEQAASRILDSVRC